MARRVITPEQRARRYEKNKAWRQANPEKWKASQARYRAANKSKTRDRSARHYAAHKSGLNVRHANWRRDHPGKCAEYSRKHAKANPEKVRNDAAIRRARKRDNGVATSRCELAAIKALYVEAALVGEITGVEHHVDHVIPIAKGGPHRLWNLQILPKPDNLSKHANVDADLMALL